MNRLLRGLCVSAFACIAINGCALKSKSDVDASYKQLYHELFDLQKIVKNQDREIKKQKEQIKRLEGEVLESKINQDVESNVLSTEPGAYPGADKLAEQAVVLNRKNKIDELKHVSDLLIKGFPESPATHNTIIQTADSLFRHGRYDESAKYYEHIFKNAPDGNKAATSLFGLARSYEKQGKREQAKIAYDTLVSTYPGSREVRQLQKEKLAP